MGGEGGSILYEKAIIQLFEILVNRYGENEQNIGGLKISYEQSACRNLRT